MNYYERFLGDYAKKAGHLTMIEHGAYTLLLDLYYVREEALPGDVNQVCRLARAQSKPERDAVSAVLQEFFDAIDGRYVHRRCEQVIAEYHAKRQKASRSAHARWDAQKTDSERNANAMRTHKNGNALQSPVPSTQEEEKKGRVRAPGFDPLSVSLPEWMPPETWARWAEYRRSIKKALTRVAVDQQIADLDKWREAGHNPVEIINTSIRNSWQGLFEPKGAAPAQRDWKKTPTASEEYGPI